MIDTHRCYSFHRYSHPKPRRRAQRPAISNNFIPTSVCLYLISLPLQKKIVIDISRSIFAGTRILTLGDVPKDQQYPLRLKGIAVCFSMLRAALSGNYVNFGVFHLYGDSALDDALQTFVKLLLSISQHDLLVSVLCGLFCLKP